MSELSDLRIEVAELKRLLLIIVATRPQTPIDMLTPAEFARMTGISAGRVRNLMSAGKLPWVTPTGDESSSRRIPVVAIQSMILRGLERFPDLDYSLIARLLGVSSRN